MNCRSARKRTTAALRPKPARTPDADCDLHSGIGFVVCRGEEPRQGPDEDEPKNRVEGALDCEGAGPPDAGLASIRVLSFPGWG